VDFPARIAPRFLPSFSRYCVKEWRSFGLTAPTETTYPAANRAYFIPLTIPFQFNAKRVFVANGAGVSGNFDIGVYSISGGRLYSLGSTVQSGTTTQFVALSPDWWLQPGSYYLAFVLDNASGHVSRSIGGSPWNYKASGIAKQESAFPLPASASLVAAEDYIPLFGLTSTT
jgi:hypothetical protein